MILLGCFLALLVTGTPADLPACAAGVSKPPGGIWSEWVITGPQKCSTSCGSCSKLFYTRKCLTTRAGVPCVGDSTRLYPCNTQTCIYPAQRTCCIPFVPMLINGSMQCGPLPKDPIASLPASSKPCCPVGGLWTEWTTYGRNGTSSYIRSRECTTLESGCPCTGKDIEFRADCPCPKTLNRASSCESEYQKATMFRPMAIDNRDCTAILEVDANNDVPTARYCEVNVGFPFVPVLRFFVPGMPTTGLQCPQDRPFDCRQRPAVMNYEKMPVSFTCDLETLNWVYDYRGWQITGYVQLNFV